MSSYPWLEQNDYDKAKGQMKLQVMNVMEIFNCYGMGIHIPSAADEIVSIAELFGQRVRGKDVPITRAHANNRRRK